MQRHRTAASYLVRTIALGAMAVLAFGCQPITPDSSSEVGGISMQRARSYVHRLENAAADQLTDAQVVALGYQERARRGLGSPFRLMDFALRDPELSAQERTAVAYALLARAQEGRTYEVDPRVLDGVHLAGVPRGARTGADQLALIERVIGTAPTAEAGERTVRVGYQLATAERTVTTSLPSVVSHVAALVADRRRAREDANRLIAAARAARVSPLDLLPGWRAERRFSVEAPAMAGLSVREEEAVATQAPRSALAIRAIAQRMSAAGGGQASLAAGDGPTSLLSAATAASLREVALRRAYPPQAPISVALLINRDEYLDGAGMPGEGRAARAAFTDSTWNEELFAAGLVLQEGEPGGDGLRLRLIELQAAVFFRVWNQEQPWFPGDAAPATKDLVARFGLAGVSFGDQVPEAWRPYYRRTLAHGLTDLQRVLPTASLRGLTIRFDELPGERRALALHDPGSRTLYLPPRTGAGTLAHEIAHDLDWQLGRNKYNARRGYATDLAVNRGRGDRLAYALSGLAASLTQADSVTKPHETRPAEVFARGTDWFIAALLARDGRAGGYLTSFQDPALTGYGTTRGPDIGGGAVGSLLDIMQGIAPVDPRAAEWALEMHGPQRRLSPAELTRVIASAGSDLPPLQRFRAITATRDRSLSTIDNASCRVTSAEGVRRLTAAQRNLIDAAARASARGAAIEAGREKVVAAGLGGDLADAWMANRLYGAPAPADSTLTLIEPALEEIVYHLESVNEERSVELVNAFDFTPQPQLCGGNPFASEMTRAGRRADAGSFDRP